MMNILITDNTSRVSKGGELQERGDRYKKNFRKANRLRKLWMEALTASRHSIGLNWKTLQNGFSVIKDLLI